MVRESVGFNFWVYSFGCRSIPFYLFYLSPDLCCVHFSKLVAPFVPLLFLEVEELPFSCLLAETILVSWHTCFVHFLASGGRKERVDWVVLVLEMGISSVAAVFTS